VPQVAPLFWTFRIMVGLGVFFIVMMVTFFILASRRRLEKHRWLLWVAVWAIPLPWVAIECGWFVAEFGRQPWIIEGVLPTAAAVSHLGIWDVLITICGFVIIYSTLAVIEVKLMLKAIRKGPQFETAHSKPNASLPSPGMHAPKPVPAE
jgi:cytochrome d ubiquinol oxidase subunit I